MPSGPILLGVGEHGRSVGLDMLVDPDAGAGLGWEKGQRPTTSSGSWRRSSPFNSIRSRECALVVAVPQPVEIRYAVFVTGHGLAIRDHRARTQTNQRLNDQWEAMGQAVA